MQNQEVVASKMAELWPFENVGSRTLRKLLRLGTTESSSKSKSIWPIINQRHFM